MNHPLYENSLCTALGLMIFFGLYFLIARTPDRAIYANYLRSRRTMGMALLLLAANYLVHLFCGIRFRDHSAAILMNLSTYFLSYWLFSSALTTLLNRFYITRRRLTVHLLLWAVFTILSGVVLLVLPEGTFQQAGLLTLALWLVTYGIWLARRLILTYHRAVRLFDDTHSDDIGAYIRWMSVFTWWAVIFGVGCGLLTFLPDRYIVLWILSSIPFYVYLYWSYLNYLLFYEQVEGILETELPTDDATDESAPRPTDADTTDYLPLYYTAIAQSLEKWKATAGYTHHSLTIEEVAEALGTNRTYLTGYLKDICHASFREWIADLRVEHAKRMLAEQPELTVGYISEASGFLSQSYFTKIFADKEGCTPARWRKVNGQE